MTTLRESTFYIELIAAPTYGLRHTVASCNPTGWFAPIHRRVMIMAKKRPQAWV